MSASPLSHALDFIKAGQNQDGGWGYRPGGASYVEPTAFCVLALLAGGNKTATGRGLAFLKACQKASGAVGISPKDDEGSWMAYAALLAFHGLAAAPEEERLKTWIMSFEDASGRFTPAVIKSIQETYRYDASIKGWSWTANMTGWVEPTALFIIALVGAGIAPTHDRIRSGVKLILDRRVPSGGWNFGNPYSKSFELDASPMPTALALAALCAAGTPREQHGIAEGIRFLERGLAGDVSTASLAWTLLASKGYPAGAPLGPKAAARLTGLQAADGSFHRNLFETALAYIVLTDTGALLKPARKSP